MGVEDRTTCEGGENTWRVLKIEQHVNGCW